jgi:hypothetical protein
MKKTAHLLTNKQMTKFFKRICEFVFGETRRQKQERERLSIEAEKRFLRDLPNRIAFNNANDEKRFKFRGVDVNFAKGANMPIVYTLSGRQATYYNGEITYSDGCRSYVEPFTEKLNQLNAERNKKYDSDVPPEGTFWERKSPKTIEEHLKQIDNDILTDLTMKKPLEMVEINKLHEAIIKYPNENKLAVWADENKIVLGWEDREPHYFAEWDPDMRRFEYSRHSCNICDQV